MSGDMLEREDLSVYVVAGVPRSFKRKLQGFVEAEAKGDSGVLLLEEELSEWLIARLRGEKRQPWEQTAASAALWRAYRALSAARYHLQHEPQEERVRELRAEIEELWRELSPSTTPEATEAPEAPEAPEAASEEEVAETD
jgi:hypothetical protein